MLLKELIENAEKTLGSQKALSLAIGQAPSYIRGAKAGLNSLPTYACIQLAKIINVPEITVIAASELVTEKRAERRAIFAPFCWARRFISDRRSNIIKYVTIARKRRTGERKY